MSTNQISKDLEIRLKVFLKMLSTQKIWRKHCEEQIIS